jgi:hypothetical protein
MVTVNRDNALPLGRRILYASGREHLWAVQKRTKPPGTSGSLAFPCKRADHLEVSWSERYPQHLRPSNGSDKFPFHRMWTTVWKRCALQPDALWTLPENRSCQGGGPCGNLSSRWSDLFCLAIYVPLSSTDLGFVALRPDCAEFVPSPQFAGCRR